MGGGHKCIGKLSSVGYIRLNLTYISFERISHCCVSRTVKTGLGSVSLYYLQFCLFIFTLYDSGLF